MTFEPLLPKKRLEGTVVAYVLPDGHTIQIILPPSTDLKHAIREVREKVTHLDLDSSYNITSRSLVIKCPSAVEVHLLQKIINRWFPGEKEKS